MTLVGVLAGIYLIGIAIGLAVMRDGWGTRLITAALWPLGVLALAVVVVVFSGAAVYLWPIPVLVTAALVAAIFVVF